MLVYRRGSSRRRAGAVRAQAGLDSRLKQCIYLSQATRAAIATIKPPPCDWSMAVGVREGCTKEGSNAHAAKLPCPRLQKCPRLSFRLLLFNTAWKSSQRSLTAETLCVLAIRRSLLERRRHSFERSRHSSMSGRV
jgi:hypothetical protein